MDDEAFAVDDQCNILVHVESDTLYFDLVKMPNSLELTNILRPRYQIAETKMNPALASEKKQGFRDKIYRDLHTYFMFKADPQKAEKESGVTDVQNTQLMICKYEEACTQRYKLKANREFMMLQKILLRDAGIMGQTRRNLLDQSPLVSINGIKRIEIYDDELTFQSRNQTIDKVQISSESHRNFFLLAMDGIIYKYDLVTKEPLFQFRSIHSPAMSLYDKDDKLCVCSDSEIRLWDFFDHREEAPELISIEITPIKIELAWINKNSKEFQGLFVSGREYIFYTGRLKKIFHDSLEDEIATITSAEFSYDEKALFLGTSRGKIIRLDAETGKQEGNAITVQDDKKITHLVRFKGMQDQNVFLCVSGKKELYVYSESRSSVEPIDFGGEHDSEVYIGLNITDVAVSDNAKFFVIGIPEKKAFGVFTFNRTNFISKPIRWITDISFEHFFADDLLSTVLFMDTTKKTLDHHFLLWRFDTTKLDHKALHKLDVGLLPGGEFQEGETDYGTEGDESPGFEGVERSNNSQCCIMF